MQTELTFRPQDWHSCTEETWRDCDAAVACYSYALNEPAYYWSVPGLGYIKSRPQPYFDTFNHHFRSYSLAEFHAAMIKGAVRDGLVSTAEPVQREGYRLVALFLCDDPDDFDLHWYRQDDDGTWSHKDGWRAPLNRNRRGEPILDPRAEPSPDYPVFGSFFHVPLQGIKLVHGFPVTSSTTHDTVS